MENIDVSLGGIMGGEKAEEAAFLSKLMQEHAEVEESSRLPTAEVEVERDRKGRLVAVIPSDLAERGIEEALQPPKTPGGGMAGAVEEPDDEQPQSSSAKDATAAAAKGPPAAAAAPHDATRPSGRDLRGVKQKIGELQSALQASMRQRQLRQNKKPAAAAAQPHVPGKHLKAAISVVHSPQEPTRGASREPAIKRRISMAMKGVEAGFHRVQDEEEVSGAPRAKAQPHSTTTITPTTTASGNR